MCERGPDGSLVSTDDKVAVKLYDIVRARAGHLPGTRFRLRVRRWQDYVRRGTNLKGDPVLENPAKEIEFMRVLGEPTHPHVLRYIGAGQDGAQAYIIMEFAPGGDLIDALLAGALLRTEEEIRVAMRDVLRGVEHMHALRHVLRDDDGDVSMLTYSLAHLDLSLENALIGAVGAVRDVKVMDFGLTIKLAREGPARDGPVIPSPAGGYVVGKARYYSPEVRISKGARFPSILLDARCPSRRRWLGAWATPATRSTFGAAASCS